MAIQEQLDQAHSEISKCLREQGKLLVSVTGLRVKKWFLIPWFFRHAIPCLSSAQKSSGNVFTAVSTIDGVQHTLTIWKDKKSMLGYVYGNPHKKAISVFRRIAKGSTVSYELTYDPNKNNTIVWEKALDHWRKNGKSYD